jgi:N-acyl-D-amino-acid deacylase
MYDIILRGGTVVDGTANQPFEADVGISGRVIKAVGNLGGRRAKRVIDATGLVVSPGFIDMHTHSDFTLMINPRAESKIRQGIATEVVGNCGLSAAPVTQRTRQAFIEYMNSTFPELNEAEIAWDWSSFDEYCRRFWREPKAVNVAFQVGFSAIRCAVLGFDNRPPTADELQTMRRFVQESLEAGAVGMSTGLPYPPDCFANTRELVEVSRALRPFDAFYVSHIRNEANCVTEAVAEAITIGKEAGVGVHVSHLKAGGKSNWGKVGQLLEMLEEANTQGVQATCDAYPYTFSSTGIISLIPPSVCEGGVLALSQKLKDGAFRQAVRELLDGSLPESEAWENPVALHGWENIGIGYCKINKQFQGKTLGEIAKSSEKDPYEIVFDLIEQEGAAVKLLFFGLDEQDVATVLRHPLSMVGSDGRAVAPYGPLGVGRLHPRYYGAFPRFLGRYVRELELLPLQEAVAKITSAPARRLRLVNRGLLKVGMFADVTIFDPETIIDRADLDDPHRYPEGIPYVLVNGEVAIDSGEHTGVLAGERVYPRPPLTQ